MSKIIAITGAGTGLGRALARRFAADGETLVLLGRRLAKIEAAAAEIGGGALALACDVSSPDAVRRAFAAIAERHGRLDVLINNAAVVLPFLITEGTDEQIQQTLAINLAGPIWCARAAAPLMGRGGHIINVSSETVLMEHYPYMALYQCSKAGLERLSQSLGHELQPRGIRVTSVRAGKMVGDDMTWDVDPELAARFHAAALAAGVDIAKAPKSQFASLPGIFRALIDLPEDVEAPLIALRGRTP